LGCSQYRAQHPLNHAQPIEVIVLFPAIFILKSNLFACYSTVISFANVIIFYAKNKFERKSGRKINFALQGTEAK